MKHEEIRLTCRTSEYEWKTLIHKKQPNEQPMKRSIGFQSSPLEPPEITTLDGRKVKWLDKGEYFAPLDGDFNPFAVENGIGQKLFCEADDAP